MSETHIWTIERMKAGNKKAALMCRPIQTQAKPEKLTQASACSEVVFALNQLYLVAAVILGVIYKNPYKSITY